MKIKVIKDNWPQRTIQISTGEIILLTADDEDDVAEVSATNSAGTALGGISVSRIEVNLQGDEALFVTSLGLDKLGRKYTRQGIGEAILRMIKENTELPIIATCPLVTTKRSDGAELIGNGPGFVSRMRELGVIELGCEGDCLCGPDTSMDYYDEQPDE